MTTANDNRDTFHAEQLEAYRADAPAVVPPALHALDFGIEDGVYTRQHEAYAGSIVTVEATDDIRVVVDGRTRTPKLDDVQSTTAFQRDGCIIS